MNDAQGGLSVQEGRPSEELPVQEASFDRPNSPKEAKQTVQAINWKAIKHDFITNSLSASTLAKKYGIGQWLIYKRSQREGWSRAASPVRRQARQAVKHVTSVAVAQAIKQVEPAIQEEVKAWTERIRKTGAKVVDHADLKLSNHDLDTKDLKELASTADIADRMVRRSLGLDSPDSTSSSRPTVLALSVRLESLGLSEQSPVPAIVDVETVKEGAEHAGNGPIET